MRAGHAEPGHGRRGFANNYAFNPQVRGLPTGDFSVELWARTPAHSKNGSVSNAFMTCSATRRTPSSPPAAPVRPPLDTADSLEMSISDLGECRVPNSQ